ncbi:major facilitator superfamily domain-containing protein 6-like [Stegodyphus dumicola]|uniref:major facilitator superfamily domain-containing protein 6-like n=1 Tax=Stegodyphus dumicola TaxID=202533 RepID=UPI0015ADBE4D|nr:major facilitator superfamily domain-containing protein 6-like [Stegodyphus dumicola]
MAVCGNINKRLLPMKMVMFGWFGASACALPFMTVHMKELGLTVEETAIVYTLLPVTQFLSSPIAGFIADRLGKYRNVLLLSIIMTIILATCLLYVPAVNKNSHPKIWTVKIVCDHENVTAERCENTAVTNGIENTHLEPCHFNCSTATKLSNNSWSITFNVTNKVSSEECEYYASSVCALSIKPISPNCSIICNELNTTESMPSDNIRNGQHLTFYLYSLVRIVYNIFSAIGFTLVNSSALALTETDTELGEYGRQRFWAILAMAIFSPLAGILVDVISTGDRVINYAPAFHTHNILALLTAVAVWYLDFEMEDAPQSYIETFKNFWTLIRSPSIFFLLLVLFWLGTMWGFLESFLFWFMLELGSPTYMLGLTITVGSLVGLPFLHYARFLVSKIGYANLVSAAAFMYMIRCVGCSYLVDPWWIMPFEALEIFTYHLMWVAAATYAAHLSSPGLLATIQGFIDGIHYGVGQGSGSMIGGSLMSVLGSRQAFRVMGGISGLVALTYSFLHLVWLRKESAQPQSRRASIKSFGSHKYGKI